jgi:hypothetical protein
MARFSPRAAPPPGAHCRPAACGVPAGGTGGWTWAPRAARWRLQGGRRRRRSRVARRRAGAPEACGPCHRGARRRAWGRGGVAAGDGVPREGRPQATGEVRWRPPVSPPRPGQEPLAGRDESRAPQGHGLAQGRRRGVHGARPQAVSRVTPAEVHAPSVQLKTTVP